jgi:hypothetical protein
MDQTLLPEHLPNKRTFFQTLIRDPRMPFAMIFLYRAAQIAHHLSVHVSPNISPHKETNLSEQETIKDLMYFLVFEINVHDALRCVWNSREAAITHLTQMCRACRRSHVAGR